MSKTSLAMTLRPGLIRACWRQLRAVDQDVNRPTDFGDVEGRVAEPIDARHLGAVKRDLFRNARLVPCTPEPALPGWMPEKFVHGQSGVSDDAPERSLSDLPMVGHDHGANGSERRKIIWLPV